jgi:hypothetical protein
VGADGGEVDLDLHHLADLLEFMLER